MKKTITELRNTLFETLQKEVELHNNFAIGYAQALRGEGISTSDLKPKLKKKEKELRAKYA